MAMSIEAQLEAVGVSIVENSNVFTEQYEWIEPHDQHTVTDELSFWVDKLPQDSMKNRSRYLVIPSQGIVAPINSIYQGDPDYERIKFGKTFELNRHLKNGILRYPFT